MQVKKFLSEAITSAPSADNSQPWKVVWNHFTINILYDDERVRQCTFPADSPATLLSIGAAIENLYQAAEIINVIIVVHQPVSFDKNNPVYFSADIICPSKAVKIPDTPPPLFQRHTNRYAFQAIQIPLATKKLLKKLTENEIRMALIDNPQEIKRIGHLVYLASQIRFRTRELIEWLGKSLRFDRQEVEHLEDGLDIATLGLPPGGSLFLKFSMQWQRMKWLNHVGIYKIMSWVDCMPVKKAPALVAIIGPEGFHESLSAGRLMQRAWIELNAQGIAVHPYYVIADQINRLEDMTTPDELKIEAEKVCKTATKCFTLAENETLHMLLRIGYPLKKAKRSKRLPLEKICQQLD